VRLRIDGELRQGEPIALALREPLLAHIKREAGLDLEERRLPQSGLISLRTPSTLLACQVEVSPGVNGEKLSLSLRAPLRQVEMKLAELGMAPEQLEPLRAALRQRSGLIVFTGPVMSGMNTAAYASLLEMGPQGRSMASIEYVVRGILPDVHQLVLNLPIGLGMSTAMRALLRGDHEVIYLRELIDLEGAELCMRAVLSQGRLVLTTVHTQDAATVATRLEDMGVERWLIARALLLVQAQRQVRRLCPRCRRAIKVKDEVLTTAGLSPQGPLPEALYVPGGCEHCEGTGYSGRLLLCETLPVTPTLQELLLSGVPARELKQAAVRAGMRTLRASGLERVCEGVTSLDEVLLGTPPDEGPQAG
jgi:type IV pilus assembly protein PilB